MHELRAPRYIDARNQSLATFIHRKLHYLDFDEAMKFYRAVTPTLRPIDQALLACNDRFFFLVGVLNRKDMRHPWLYDRCREVESDTDGFLDLWARAHYKSTIITFAGTIQEILVDPEITIAVFSFNSKTARKFVGQIKHEFEKNPTLHEICPDVAWKVPRRESPRWSMTEGLVFRRKSNPKEATIEGHGLIDGMPTGGHWRLLIYDDIITEKYAKNPDMVIKATEQWEMSDNLGVGDGTRKQMIGTRYSFGDSYATVLMRGVNPRIHAATENGKLDGKPVFLSPGRWEEIKRVQRSTVAAQMLQNPLAGSENTFKEEWYRAWEIRPSVVNVYIMVDPNKGMSRRSDRTGIAVVAVDGAGVKYLVDGYRHRMSLEDRWVAVRDLYNKWSRMPGVSMVEVGYERYGARTDEDYFRERMKESKAAFDLKILNWPASGGGSKEDRVERLEPDFRNGRFYLPAVIWDAKLHGQCLWRFDSERQSIVDRAMERPTAAMARVQGAGAGYLAAKPIMRKDEDGRLYDVTVALMEEMRLFPFAPKDDLVDALSRIYDMEIVSPSFQEDREIERLSRAYEEAV